MRAQTKQGAFSRGSSSSWHKGDGFDHWLLLLLLIGNNLFRHFKHTVGEDLVMRSRDLNTVALWIEFNDDFDFHGFSVAFNGFELEGTSITSPPSISSCPSCVLSSL